ncbi:hypothetical protein [Flavobacterium sp.]|uniref:hypothetical protein n=1 Tax=Flavobacterium sp. TaxID=239 RepID=UPI0039E49084
MKNALLFLVLFFALKNYGQEASKKREFAFSPGILWQDEIFAEANVLVGKVIIEKAMVGMSGITAGLETNFKSGHEFTVAPKIGIESDMTIASVRLSAINYFQDGNSELRLVPEIGLSFGGFANLTYGYGFILANDHIQNASQHRLSLRFTFNKRLIREGLPLMY